MQTCRTTRNQVSASAFLTAVADGEDAVILDVRSAEDYAAGHVQGAINVPYGVDVAAALDKIPTDKTVYVYCYSGQTASQTVLLLNLAGKQAVNVSGGFDNGISKEEAAVGLMTTEETTFGEETYAVDADIQTAIEDYYKQTAKETYGKNNISAAQLAELMENSADEICVVDLRSAEDYAAGHIEGRNQSAVRQRHAGELLHPADQQDPDPAVLQRPDRFPDYGGPARDGLHRLQPFRRNGRRGRFRLAGRRL